MTDEKPKQTEPPLFLDMPFGDALKRFAQTKAEEIEVPAGRKPKVVKAAKRLAASSLASENKNQVHHDD